MNINDQNTNVPTEEYESPNYGKRKIHEFLKDHPEVEELRKQRHAVVMKGNTYSYKNGKYSEYHKRTKFTEAWMDFIDEFNIKDPKERQEIVYQILRDRLKTYGINAYYEAADGYIIDAKLQKMSFSLIELLLGSIQVPPIKSAEIKPSSLTEEERNTAVEVLDEIIKKIEKRENK